MFAPWVSPAVRTGGMEAVAGTRTAGGRMGAVAEAPSTAGAVAFMEAGPVLAGILALGTLAVGILVAGVLVVAVLVVGMETFRAGWVLRTAGTGDLTEDPDLLPTDPTDGDLDRILLGDLKILGWIAAVGREPAVTPLGGQIRGVGPGVAQARTGAMRSGRVLRSARTGRRVLSEASAMGREEVVRGREMVWAVQAAGREETPGKRIPGLIPIDLLACS